MNLYSGMGVDAPRGSPTITSSRTVHRNGHGSGQVGSCTRLRGRSRAGRKAGQHLTQASMKRARGREVRQRQERALDVHEASPVVLQEA